MTNTFSVSFTLVLILALIVGVLSAIAIAKFFNITIDEYAPYLSWVIALGLFTLILPKRGGLVFLKKFSD